MKGSRNMGKVSGSKDGHTWEEMSRTDNNSAVDRFGNKRAIRNLQLLKQWCAQKISELAPQDTGNE